MHALCAAKAPEHKYRFQSKLFSLDSTSIKLCLPLFHWASFRKCRGGIKIHTLLDIPAFTTTVTDARTHGNRIDRSLELTKDSIVVFDKGFLSYLLKASLTTQKMLFLSRSTKP